LSRIDLSEMFVFVFIDKGEIIKP